MLFHEIYGVYYHTLSRILDAAIEGSLTEDRLTKLIRENAFGESILTVLPALKSGRWQLLTSDLRTPIRKNPVLPLTVAEKRWLKAITLDKRFALFGVEISGLCGVEPLFTPEDVCIFDRYGDGDPYDDPNYQRNFHIILAALWEKVPLSVEYEGKRGKSYGTVLPVKLEYSEKDDKFRLLTVGHRVLRTLNLSRISFCQPTDMRIRGSVHDRGGVQSDQVLVMELEDVRNGLERVNLHFSHFEKETERIGERRYRLRLHYDQSDETELLIRVLSFGPVLKVVEPESFVELIRERLRKQTELSLR